VVNQGKNESLREGKKVLKNLGHIESILQAWSVDRSRLAGRPKKPESGADQKKKRSEGIHCHGLRGRRVGSKSEDKTQTLGGEDQTSTDVGEIR